MAKIRAKMFVAELKKAAWNPEAVTVTLNAVSRGEENKEWAAATPSGQIVMTVSAPIAAEMFGERLGKEMFVDFTDVE